MRSTKGQNMIEYVLVVAAVLLVCIYFFTSQLGGTMPNTVNASLNSIVKHIDNLSGQIQFQ